IHPRAVEIAMNAKIPLRVRSTYSVDEGTLITTKETYEVEERLITGVTHVPNVAQIKVRTEHATHNLQTHVFKAMAKANISVDFINILPTEVIYTVYDHVADKVEEILSHIGYEPIIIRNCAKVSIIGAGMNGVPGVTSKIVMALSAKEIPILQSADSHTTIWILVQEEHMITAVNTLHETFELSK